MPISTETRFSPREPSSDELAALNLARSQIEERAEAEVESCGKAFAEWLADQDAADVASFVSLACDFARFCNIRPGREASYSRMAERVARLRADFIAWYVETHGDDIADLAAGGLDQWRDDA